MEARAFHAFFAVPPPATDKDKDKDMASSDDLRPILAALTTPMAVDLEVRPWVVVVGGGGGVFVCI